MPSLDARSTPLPHHTDERLSLPLRGVFCPDSSTRDKGNACATCAIRTIRYGYLQQRSPHDRSTSAEAGQRAEVSSELRLHLSHPLAWHLLVTNIVPIVLPSVKDPVGGHEPSLAHSTLMW